MNMLGIALLALVLQVPPQQQPPGFIEGVVVKIGSGEPLRDASVALNRTTRDGAAIDPMGRIALKPPGELFHRTATTDQNGRFVFDNVLPGDYQMIATKSAYVPAEYGQRSITGKGIEFYIAAGQKMAGIQLAMAPTGSISGRVYDRDGEPLVKAQVQALRAVYKDGRRSMTIVQMAETDDRGEYRLFWLAPGRYYVSVKPDVFELPIGPMGFAVGGPKGAAVRITEPARYGNYEQGSSPLVRTRRLRTGEVVEETSTPVYYPGTIDMQGAAPIAVPAAATIGGVDISVEVGFLPARHIRGRVINAADGQPVSQASVMAIPRDSGPVLSIPSGPSNGEGFFDLAGALPGRYFLVASSRGGNAIVPVDITDRDVTNIPLVVNSGFSISGRFIVEGRSRSGAELRPDMLRINALTREQNLLGMPGGGPSFNPPAAPDGSFKIDGVSLGDFRVSIRGVPPDGYVKSIRLGNADVLNDGLHITGPPEGLLEIVVSANAGAADGSVVNSRQEPLANRTVVLIPDVRLRHRTDLYKVVASDASGRFRFQGIAPGDYKLFAWDDVEAGAWHDPDFIRLHENSGKPIHVREGGDESVQLAVTP